MTLPWHPHDLFVILFLIFGLITVLVNYFTVRRFDQFPLANKFPRVSILVPARNEKHNIENCVVSLLSQDYPDFEVIVLDDHSNDDTLDVLLRLARQNPQLQILNGTPLPEGWMGKHWACHQLYQSSNGEFLLYTDADTIHSPDMLKASISALLSEKADLVTAFPRQEVVTWGEKLLVPFMGFGIFTFIPIFLVQKLRWKTLSVTIGQFMLFRRSAFEAVGGYEAVRGEIVDDICLGRNIIAWGGQWRLMSATRHISCRMYRGFWEAVNGLGKSIFAVFDYRIIPFFAGLILLGVVFLEPPVALISLWLRHPLTPLTPEAATLAVALSLTLWTTAYRRFKFPAYMVLFHPVTMFLFILVALRSFIHTASGTARWKERILERPDVRWL